MTEQVKFIPARLKSAVKGGHVTGAEDIDAGGGKTQQQANKDVDDALTLHQQEINALDGQNYVTVTAYSSLPATGAVNTIYRVSSYDGTQIDATKYAEYAWNGSAYVLLDVKTQVGEVFDISQYKAVGGTLATFDDLADALDSGNNVPSGLRKGGMSVKFVCSSDNKYVQFFCTADEFTTNVTKWQGVDDEPTAGSENLVKSDGVCSYIKENVLSKIEPVELDVNWNKGYIGTDGTIVDGYSGYQYSDAFLCNQGDVLRFTGAGANISVVAKFTTAEAQSGVSLKNNASGDFDVTIQIEETCYIRCSSQGLNHSLYISNSSTITNQINVINNQLFDVDNSINSAEKVIGIANVEVLENKQINIGSVSPGGTVNMEPSDADEWFCTIVNTENAKTVNISGVGGNGPRLWFFVDSLNKLLTFAPAGTTLDNGIVEVPENAAKLVVNSIGVVPMAIVRSKNERTAIYDVYIAGYNSKYRDNADYVCTGSNDQEVINAALNKDGVKTVYFYSDSTFILSAPIVPKSNQSLISNGAFFTVISCITKELVQDKPNASNRDYIYINSLSDLVKGMYLYVADKNLQMDYMYIRDKGTDNTGHYIAFTSRNGHSWLMENDVVIKTGSPGIMLDNVDNVVIDGLHIDLNVTNNPKLPANPWFIQDIIASFRATNITIKNCRCVNTGRRGFCPYEGNNFVVNNCYFENCHEHGIDIFTADGRTLPDGTVIRKEQNVLINNNIILNNKQCGVQCHQGSGVVITNNYISGNDEHGVSNQETAHDNIIANNIICHNKRNGVYMRDNVFNVVISNNTIFDNGETGYDGININVSKNITIKDNMISRSYGRGINLRTGSKCIISGNHLVDNCRRAVEEPSIDYEYKSAIALLGGSSQPTHRNMIVNNIIEQNNAYAQYGIIEQSNGADYDIVKDNMFIGIPTLTRLLGAHSIDADNYDFSETN